MHLTLVCPACLSVLDVYRTGTGKGYEPGVAHCYACSHEWRVRTPRL